ncbi:unnamed protein product [Cylindrotheca closterium]|uniref:Uncharacterized protein n=1 Tax=Cylindrotheca closterium TaxID=2856 RepID=A0AAD2FMZ9_9STRA|nr:unnamed protein product [Cylindrotheca closterium]
MRKKSPRFFSRCFPLSRFNKLVILLFAVTVWNHHQDFQDFSHRNDDFESSGRDLHHRAEVSSINQAGLQVDLQDPAREHISEKNTYVGGKASQTKLKNTDDVVTPKKPTSKQVVSEALCSGQNPKPEVSVWIPASPDQSIASRLQMSVGDISDVPPANNAEENSSDGTKNVANELCPLPTSQVNIISKCTHWILQSLDANGNPKTVGGDEFYVTYHDYLLETTNNVNATSRPPPPAAVAKIQDFSNGTYLLKFIESPFLPSWQHGHLLNGTISVTFQYTCGMGSWSPPTKERWKSSGAVGVTHSYYPVQLAPPKMQPFEPPTMHMDWEESSSSNDSKFSASPRTRLYLDWTSTSISDSEISSAKLNESSSYKEPHILAFGDSLMQQFVKSWKQTEIPNVGMPLNTTTVKDWIQLLERRLGSKLKALTSGSKAETTSVALIVGSSTWDLLEAQSADGWEDHASAMKTLIGFIQEHYLSKSKNLRLFWKSPTAMHIHIPLLENEGLQKDDDGGRLTKLNKRIKYMSTSRSDELYAVQKKVCTFLKTPFLDVYETSYLSAHHTQVGDGRHYDEEFNRYTLQSFFKYTTVEHFWYRYQWKILSNSKSNRILSVWYCPDSWLDAIQAVLLAAVTNRQLEFDPTRACDGWKNYEPYLLQRGLEHSLESTTGNKKHAAKLEGKLPFPLSLDALVEHSWIPNSIGSPSYQVAMEAFEEGPSYLYGMIWYNLLCKSSSLSQADDQRQAAFQNSNDHLVLSVSNDSGQGDIRRCVSEKLLQALGNLKGRQDAVKLGCKVLFTFEQDRKLWKETLQNEYNCTAELLPLTGTAIGSEIHNGQSSVEKTLIWHQAHAIAKMAKDGYIARCDEPDDILFNSLVHYIRAKEGRENHLSPIEEWACCI